MQIRWIESPVQKEEISSRILGLLPEWFGIPESTAEYIRESQHMPFLALMDAEEPIGFLALKRTSEAAAEIYVMGIAPAYHRLGGGRMLVEASAGWCKEHALAFLQVKTLDASHPDPCYRRTRAFYKAMGFRPLECLPSLWGEENPCLIMIRTID